MYDNFLSTNESNNYINVFNNNRDKIISYRNTFTLKINDDFLLDKLKFEFKIDKLQQPPDNLEIVQWPTESFMNPHYDKGDSLAFIIYLNDNYIGGETMVDKIKVTPKAGKIIIFSNSRLEHCVNKIEEGIRYTLAGWYV